MEVIVFVLLLALIAGVLIAVYVLGAAAWYYLPVVGGFVEHFSKNL